MRRRSRRSGPDAPGDDGGRAGRDRSTRSSPRSGRSPRSRRGSGPRPVTATSSASPHRPATSPTSSSSPSRARDHRRRRRGAPAARPRPGAAVRVERAAPARPATILGALLDDPAYRAAPRGARRSPGGDARLLRFEQGIGLPGGRLDAPPGAVGARRGGPGARRRADAVPRPGRRARARRRSDQPGDPRPGAGLGRRPPQADRAGRGHRRQLRRPDDRPPPPRADDRRRSSWRPTPEHDARLERALAVGAPIVDELAATVAGGLPGAGPRRPGVRLVLPRHHARSASCPTCGSGRDRRRAGGATRPRRSIRCGRSRGPSPGRRRASTCPAGTGSGHALEAYRAAHGEAGMDAPRPAGRATGRSCRASSTTPR